MAQPTLEDLYRECLRLKDAYVDAKKRYDDAAAEMLKDQRGTIRTLRQHLFERSSGRSGEERSCTCRNCQERKLARLAEERDAAYRRVRDARKSHRRLYDAIARHDAALEEAIARRDAVLEEGREEFLRNVVSLLRQRVLDQRSASNENGSEQSARQGTLASMDMQTIIAASRDESSSEPRTPPLTEDTIPRFIDDMIRNPRITLAMLISFTSDSRRSTHG
jgi:hypothetical protein